MARLSIIGGREFWEDVIRHAEKARDGEISELVGGDATAETGHPNLRIMFLPSTQGMDFALKIDVDEIEDAHRLERDQWGEYIAREDQVGV